MAGRLSVSAGARPVYVVQAAGYVSTQRLINPIQAVHTPRLRSAGVVALSGMRVLRCERCGAIRSHLAPDGHCLACARFTSDADPVATATLTTDHALALSDPKVAQANLADDVRTYLRRHDLTEGALGHKLRVSQASVSRMVSGTYAVSGNPEVIRTFANLAAQEPERYGVAGSIIADLPHADALRSIRAARALRASGKPLLGLHELRAAEASLAGLRRTADRLIKAEYRFAHGLVLSDLLPRRRLREALAETRTALDLLVDTGPADAPSAYITAQLGNQLRMFGQTKRAIEVLTKALAWRKDVAHVASTAPLAARAYGEFDKPDAFTRAIQLGRRAFEDADLHTGLLNVYALTEIEVRGWIQLGQLDQARRALKALSQASDLLASPQWRIIFAATTAELLLREGDIGGALELLNQVMRAAAAMHLTRQIERSLELLRTIAQPNTEVQEAKRNARVLLELSETLPERAAKAP
jgi:tetratricopeptide (TPR) repeat protein